MWAAALTAFLAASAATAQVLTAEEALENYRAAFDSVSVLDCPESSDPDAIVVCGRRPGAPDPNRLPLPVQPLPGDRVAGEAISSVEAAGTREKCSTVGPNQQCGGGLPVFQVIGVAVKAVQALVDPDR
jgi:hypothetical protein